MQTIRILLLPALLLTGLFLIPMAYSTLPDGSVRVIAHATIAMSVAVFWVLSGAWPGRERWTGRLQASLIGLILSVLAFPADLELSMTTAIGFVAVLAVVFLGFVHSMGHVLGDLRDGMRTAAGFAWCQAGRQTLFFASFAVPWSLGLFPSWAGLFVAVTCLLVLAGTYRRTIRRLRAGADRVAAAAGEPQNADG